METDLETLTCRSKNQNYDHPLSADDHHKAAEASRVPVEAVHHFEVHPQVLLGEVVQHARIHQALHEVAAVLR